MYEKGSNDARIVMAACLIDNNVVLCVRHHDKFIRDYITRNGVEDRTETIQGFVDKFGNFYTREEALIQMKKIGQERYARCGGDEFKLYSENLY